MSAISYLSEDGSGMYARWHFPDLVPSNLAVELVFVFESPHVDGLSALAAQDATSLQRIPPALRPGGVDCLVDTRYR